MEDNFDIQQLIETKNYSDLSKEEKNLVLRDLSMEEYEERRFLLNNTRLFLAAGVKEMNPRMDYKRSVAAILNDRKLDGKSAGIFNRIIMFRIPAYVSLTAILTVLLIIPYFFESKNQTKMVAVKEFVKPKTIVVTDTVTKEKKIPTYINVPVIKYVQVVKSVEQDNNFDLVNTMEEKELDQLMIPANIESAKQQLENQLKNIGKSANEQEELSKFIVVSQ